MSQNLDNHINGIVIDIDLAFENNNIDVFFLSNLVNVFNRYCKDDEHIYNLYSRDDIVKLLSADVPKGKKFLLTHLYDIHSVYKDRKTTQYFIHEFSSGLTSLYESGLDLWLNYMQPRFKNVIKVLVERNDCDNEYAIDWFKDKFLRHCGIL